MLFLGCANSGPMGGVFGTALGAGVALGGFILLGTALAPARAARRAHEWLDAALEVVQMVGRSNPAAVAGSLVSLLAAGALHRFARRCPAMPVALLAGLLVREGLMLMIMGGGSGLLPPLTLATLGSVLGDATLVAAAYGTLALVRLCRRDRAPERLLAPCLCKMLDAVLTP